MTTQTQHTIEKRYTNLKAAHRQWRHEGHCSGIHGENWTITLVVGCLALDERGFVIDFGGMKEIRDWLHNNFDHTLLLDEDDPALPMLQKIQEHTHIAKIVVLPSASAEGIGRYVLQNVDAMIRFMTGNRCYLVKVVVNEDEKNTATVHRAL